MKMRARDRINTAELFISNVFWKRIIIRGLPSELHLPFAAPVPIDREPELEVSFSEFVFKLNSQLTSTAFRYDLVDLINTRKHIALGITIFDARESKA